MNKVRRQRLVSAECCVSAVKAECVKIGKKTVNEVLNSIAILIDEISNIQSDEQYAFDSFPENLQYSVKGEAMEYAISEMDDAIGALDELVEMLEQFRDTDKAIDHTAINDRFNYVCKSLNRARSY